VVDGSAFAAAAVLAATVLAVFGAGELGTVDALRITARFSFAPSLRRYLIRSRSG
jgi:hypothetical protein